MESNRRIIFIALVIFLAALSRLLPHPLNFTPIGAIGLMGAAYLKPKWLAYALPFAALWLSDLILMNGPLAAFYDGFQWFGHIWVYAAFFAITSLGFLLRKYNKWHHILGASVSASLVFFLLTNFGVWLGSAFYPQNWAGLMSSYLAGLPFFWNTLAGDLFYCTVLFGAYAWFNQKYVVAEKAI